MIFAGLPPAGNAGYQSNIGGGAGPPNQSAEAQGSTAFQKKSSCLDQIERLKINREERRRRMDDIKKKRTMREENNAALGIKVDVDFQAMVEE